MPYPSTNLCYHADTASYTPGGGIDIVPNTSPLPMTGGTTGQIGFDTWAYNGGSGGQAGRLRIWMQSNNTWYDSVLVSPGMAVPFTATYTLPGSGAQNYAFSIWTDVSAYGSTFTKLWLTHPTCTGTLAPCLPRLKSGQDTQVFVTDSLLNALVGVATGGGAVRSLLGYTIGSVISIENLCTTTPPIVPTLSASMWGPPAQMAFWGSQYLLALAWWYFCECTPGTTGPLPPAPPIVDPPNRPDDPVYTPNPSNPCLDLTEIRRKLDQVLAITKSDLDADTIMQRFEVPFASVTGAAHSGLTGTGWFAIPRCIGFRVELTSLHSGDVIEGNPPYYWDQGWMSVSDGGAMLIEKRITRTSMDWYPSHAQLADQFNYFLKPGAVARVTELYAET